MGTQACRMVVADDEPIERMVLCKRIRNYFGDEVEIWEAVNGREAVRVFREKNCQVALLDISMPGIGGLEAAKEIRREDQACSIIFLTAYDEFDFAKRAIRVHALDYLLKPGTKEELIAVLEEAVHLAKRAQNRPLHPLAEEGRDGNKELEKNRILTEQIREYIEQHYMEDICLQDISSQMHYSDAYFCRFFRQNFDKNFIMYLSEVRVAKAKQLLEDVTEKSSVKEAVSS